MHTYLSKSLSFLLCFASYLNPLTGFSTQSIWGPATTYASAGYITITSGSSTTSSSIVSFYTDPACSSTANPALTSQAAVAYTLEAGHTYSINSIAAAQLSIAAGLTPGAAASMSVSPNLDSGVLSYSQQTGDCLPISCDITQCTGNPQTTLQASIG